MTIDASAVARVLGIDMQFQDMRSGSVLFLPQRIAVLAQGQTGVTFSTTKWAATSAGAAGTRFGFRSPIYQILSQLMPANGDGVGTIPVTVYPLEDDGAGAAAVGTITPSGTATAAGTYRVRVSGQLSNKFSIPAGAINVTNVCAAMGSAVSDVPTMPVTVSWTYGTVTATQGTNTGNGTCTALSVTGTPLPGAYSLVCNTAVANGGVFTLTDPNGTVIASDITMTPGAGGTTVIDEGGIQFTLTDAGTDFAVNDAFTITVPATNTKFTSAWKGESANDLVLELIGDSLGVAFAIVQPTGGSGNPSVTAALAQMGNVWETFVLNGANIEDEDTLDAIQTFGEGRWGETVRKPFVCFTGNTATLEADAVVIPSGRKDDRINGQLVAPGSVNLPCVVAARQLARIAKLANNNPPTDYGALKATGIVPGTDGVQWDYPTRDLAVKAGSSTVEVVDGVVQLSDVVTFYHPTGEEPPAYRYVVDIVKLQNIFFNVDLKFAQPEWAGAPLLPDEQPTINPNARKPKSAKTELAGVIDALGDQAILSDPATAKKTITAGINASNPKRLDVSAAVQVSGNTNIKPITIKWGFFFGNAA